MRSSRARSRSLGVLALVSFGSAAVPAFAQEAPPPIDVPTTPVPQGPAAPPPPAGAKPPPPKPAPAAAPKPAAPSGPAAPAASGTPEDKKEIKYNNEGVFKVSGSKGAGTVGGSTKAKPGAAAPAPMGGKAKGGTVSAANVAQWPGFHMTEDGGSEVMVEFSKPTAAPSEHKAAGSLTYVFKGAHVLKHNNQNPLITVHFNTPVASARLVPKQGELHLVIEYRGGADAAAVTGMRAATEGGGQQFFVKFPAGTWLPKGADSEPMPPPPTQKLKDKGKDKGDGKADSKPAPKSDSGSKTGPTP